MGTLARSIRVRAATAARFYGFAIALLVAGCTPPAGEPPKPSSSSPSGGTAAPGAGYRAPERTSSTRSIDEYKRSAAQRVIEANRDRVMPGRPQALLRAVIVMRVRVSTDGRPTAEVMRSPDAALSKVAIDTLKQASPLPAPPQSLGADLARVGYIETWLFNDDGRFQLRTVAPAQQTE